MRRIYYGFGYSKRRCLILDGITYLKKVTLEVVSFPRIAKEIKQEDACDVPRRQLLRSPLRNLKH